MGGIPITVLNNDQIDQAEREELERKAALDRQSQPFVSGLASHVRQCWEHARDAKRAPSGTTQSVYNRMLSALRQYKGVYSPEEEHVASLDGPSRVYIRLTSEKCHAAISWIMESIAPAGERAWGAAATPEPDLPPEDIEAMARAVAQSAFEQFRPLLEMSGGQVTPEMSSWIQEQGRAQREDVEKQSVKQAKREIEDAEQTIEDVLVEGGWEDALAEMVQDLVIFPAGIMKGPVYESRKVMVWGDDGFPVVENKLCRVFHRVSPFNIYPSPLAQDIQDGYLIEHHVLSRRALRNLIGVDGYDETAIKQILEEPHGLSDWLGILDETERKHLEDRPRSNEDPEERIDALQFWGWIQGQMLIDWGVDAERIPDPTEEYSAEVWLVGDWCIKAELNGDAMGRRPYHKVSFRPRPGAFWGEGIPEMIRDIQEICNATCRALENNMAMCAGFQTGVDINAIPEGANITEIFPHKIWQYDLSRSIGKGAPIQFFQPDPRVQDFKSVYEFFSAQADNVTGVPRYSYGQQQSSGPLSTAAGYSMMIENMNKGIRLVLSNLDRQIIEPVIKDVFVDLVLEGEIDYRGDLNIEAHGTKRLLEKHALTLRRNEFLQIALGSPIIQQLIGLNGLAEVLRPHVADLGLNTDDIIPSPDTIRRQEEMAAQQQAALATQQQQAMQVTTS
ncbi:portal protein [Desulfovibrio inopinatus]|uniref:portal protein n=1 Tax=Desulfovibrio inopinatus TaxID=102109 RepID=UPI0003F9664C|nr:hypothetical protein [Desulfovibrio inopinatus]